MNTIDIEIEIPDTKLRRTLHQTLDIEMEATKNDRGYAKISVVEKKLRITIYAEDYVAARALTNSILRLAKTSVDVVESISISK